MTATSASAELKWYGQSKPTTGIFVVVTGAKSIEGTRCEIYENDELLFQFHNTCQTNIDLFIPMNPSYMCVINMVDNDNHSVSKTSTGAGYGGKFGRNIKWTDVKVSSAHTFPGEFNPKEPVSGFFFTSPEKLFKMKKPGIYKMTLQFQVFPRLGTNSLALVKLPPVEVAVKKDEE